MPGGGMLLIIGYYYCGVFHAFGLDLRQDKLEHGRAESFTLMLWCDAVIPDGAETSFRIDDIRSEAADVALFFRDEASSAV